MTLNVTAKSNHIYSERWEKGVRAVPRAGILNDEVAVVNVLII